MHNVEGKCCPLLSCWCRRYASHFNAVGAAFYTTARVNAARFWSGSVGVILSNLLLLEPPFTQRRGYMLPVFRPLVWMLSCPFYCCWCRLSDNGEGKCCAFFSRWCCYAASFTAVGASFHTTANSNAARVSAVGVGVVLPVLLLLVPPFTLRRG